MSTPGFKALGLARLHLTRVEAQLRKLEQISCKQKLNEDQIEALKEASMSLSLASDTLKAVIKL